VPQAWRARVVVLVLLGAFVASFLTEAELWPMSSFRLFSGLRSDQSSSVELVAVSANGSEQRIDVQRNRTAARSALHQVSTLPHLPLAEQQKEVRAWLGIAEMDPDAFVAVRLYRVTLRHSPDDGAPPKVLSTRLQVEVPL
jgi:hypothetical protein